jgi:hypothetical protein
MCVCQRRSAQRSNHPLGKGTFKFLSLPTHGIIEVTEAAKASPTLVFASTPSMRSMSEASRMLMDRSCCNASASCYKGHKGTSIKRMCYSICMSHVAGAPQCGNDHDHDHWYCIAAHTFVLPPWIRRY